LKVITQFSIKHLLHNYSVWLQNNITQCEELYEVGLPMAFNQLLYNYLCICISVHLKFKRKTAKHVFMFTHVTESIRMMSESTMGQCL